jgi:hypothetical protein
MHGGKSMTDLAHKAWSGWRIARWTGAAILLLIPALAMQIPDSGWNWSIADFMFAGVMIVGTALIYERFAKVSASWPYRAGAAVALAAAFLLIWIDLAVGIIGSEDDPHNAVYFGEVVLGAATSFAAGLRPLRVARAMLAAGGFQLLVTALAAYAGWGAGEPPGADGIFALNLAFAALWLTSAGLFWRAERHAGRR